MEYDLATHLKALTAITPAALTAATDGAIIDTAEFNSLTFSVNVGALTTAGVLTLTEGDESDLSDGATVSTDDIIGTLPVPDTADSAYWFGYIGKKRYVQLSFASGDMTIGATAILGHPYTVPTL